MANIYVTRFSFIEIVFFDWMEISYAVKSAKSTQLGRDILAIDMFYYWLYVSIWPSFILWPEDMSNSLWRCLKERRGFKLPLEVGTLCPPLSFSDSSTYWHILTWFHHLSWFESEFCRYNVQMWPGTGWQDVTLLKKKCVYVNRECWSHYHCGSYDGLKIVVQIWSHWHKRAVN